ncbi:DUF1704 domain-containing protein [Candidatus Peregrinibacteria bacterium]|nr:DUF1704 domain-containing protein [Candidatus Peregrinibacteria bacterium]
MIFSTKGILGINARNLLYIRPYNENKAIRFADDKIKTKQFLAARDIPVPKLYGIIHDNAELEKFDFNSLPNQFALKPNKGFGGEGIIPVAEKKNNYLVSVSGKRYSKHYIKNHIRDILDGQYSITNMADYAFFEQLIVSDERIGKYSYAGLPDIRIVVHNLIPVMAMLRLPTKESQGKANLHQGAVGVGIDIAKGECTHIAYKNRIIEELPDGLGRIAGTKIPFWDDLLTIASRIQLITNLGYMAADLCIDKNIGPVLLEINARAGLGVQIANLAPLRKRLQRIEGVKVTTPQKGVRIAKDMFGHSVEKEIAQISGKEIIGTEEKVEIIQKKDTFRVLAKVDTTKRISILDEELAAKYGLLDNEKNYDDEKSTLKIKFTLKNRRIQTVVDIEKIISDKHKMILGSRDLQDFLIDTSAKEPKTEKRPVSQPAKQVIFNNRINFSEIDKQLMNIDNKIKLLFHIRPVNIAAEQEKFLKNPVKNPQFEYPKLKFDPLELVDSLNKIQMDDSPLGEIFAAKKREIALKIKLLESINETDFSETSIQLFGKPTAEEIENCEMLIGKIDIKRENRRNENEENLDAEYAREKFEKAFAKYNLNHWKVGIKEDLVSNCVAGKNNRLFVKKSAKFTKERIEALIVHEIETHILTAENGKMQPYEIFNRGLANYLKTQEGLAVYNVEQQQNAPFEKNHKAMAHVLAIDMALKGTFIEVFDKLLNLNFSKEQAFRSALKSKRGFMDTGRKGAFTKDYIYYYGYHEIKSFAQKGGDLKKLYIGKLDVADLDKIKGIPGIIEPKILPTWLRNLK